MGGAGYLGWEAGVGDAWFGRGEVGGVALEEDCVLELAGASSVNNFVFCETFFVYTVNTWGVSKSMRGVYFA